MGILDYSSLLELYIAFAFAYIGSNTFSNIINEKIFRSSEKLEKRLKKIKDLLRRSEELLTNFSNLRKKNEGDLEKGNFDTGDSQDDKKKEPFKSKFFKRIQERFQTFNKESKSFNDEKEQYFDKIKKWRDSKGFAHLSLISAIYCIFVLYAAGSFENLSHKGSLYPALLSLSFIHLILSVIFAFRDFRKNPNDIKYSNWYSIVAGGIFIFLFLIYYVWVHAWHLEPYNRLPFLGCVDVFYLDLIIVLTPLSHYVSYFLRFLIVHRSAKKEIDNLKDNYEEDLENLLADIRVNVNSLDEIINQN